MQNPSPDTFIGTNDAGVTAPTSPSPTVWGGHAAGEMTSAAVIESLPTHDAEVASGALPEGLAGTVMEANREVARRAAEDPHPRPTLRNAPQSRRLGCSPRTSVIPRRPGFVLGVYEGDQRGRLQGP